MIWRKRFLIALLAMLSAGPVFGSDKPWLEITSPHFRVLTDGNDWEGRRVAHEFEQMRAVFATNFHNFRLDTGAPLLIFAVRDENSLKVLVPEFWRTKSVKPAGFYTHGWEQQYALVRLDEVGPGSYEVIYHEYIHALLHTNFRWLPLWLDEGLAEFYGNTLFEKDKIFVGAPSNRSRYLKSQLLIPIETLIKLNQGSPYYHDPGKVDLFYGESWALVHYLTFGSGMDTGDKLNQFYGLIQQGTEESKAFTQVFGDFATLDKNLAGYTNSFHFRAAEFKLEEQVGAKSYGVRSLDPAETDAELGLYFFYHHNLEEAQARITSALQVDPKLGLAHQGMGFLDFRDGKDEEAKREFSQAWDLNNKLYLSLFFKSMMSGNTQAPEDLSALNLALLRVVETNPNFAPVYVELARMHAGKGSLDNALRMAQKAERLEPSRAGYHLLTGRILTRMGRGVEAASIAKFVADRWFGPDHNEAVEVWKEIPAAQRPTEDEPSEQIAEGAKTLEGALSSVSCADKDHKLELTVEQDGRPMKFRPEGGFLWGFSDTLWYGRDHFSLCHHLTGADAVIRYKQPADNSYAGNLIGVEIRELLPGPAPQTSPGPAAARN